MAVVVSTLGEWAPILIAFYWFILCPAALPWLPCPQPPVIDFFYCVTTEIVKLHCSGFKLKHPQLETPLAIITALNLQTWIYNRGFISNFLRHLVSLVKNLATWNSPCLDKHHYILWMWIHIRPASCLGWTSGCWVPPSWSGTAWPSWAPRSRCWPRCAGSADSRRSSTTSWWPA